MALRIAINGFGRIGRNVFRILQSRTDMEVVAINDLTDPATLAHLLKYDTVSGRFDGEVTSGKDFLVVKGKKIQITAQKDPTLLDHKAGKIDFVVEATGRLTSRADCQKHLDAGAARVLLTVPPKDDVDAMIVMGVNEQTLKASDRIISNASCTTNCLAPVAKVLEESFGIVRGLVTTVHAYTNDQNVLDLPHKDLRRARAAAQNIIPTTTGAARAVGKVLPGLKGKLDGTSMRVPVPVGSVIDLVAELKRPVTVAEVNQAFAAAAKSKSLKGVLEYCEDPIVSSDIIGNPASSIFDAQCTMVLGGSMVKVISWYDNEWAYSQRVVDLMKYASQLKLPKVEKSAAAAKTPVAPAKG